MVSQLFIAELEIPHASKIYPSRGQAWRNHELTVSFATLPGLSDDISSTLWPLFSSYFLFHATKDLDLFLSFCLSRGKGVSKATVYFSNETEEILTEKGHHVITCYPILVCWYESLRTNLISTDMTAKHSLEDSSEQIYSVK